ncbi:hypothetical protein E2C01_095475 [Portunus trituberculatus]|uniref:Uncharacterized protein n=1 Tax=Portunus trituberculatus TaxID=210409 RepID=A0A5B7K0A2_PORTR|nr:hypothetical protein [Portunus trituberculatus]
MIRNIDSYVQKSRGVMFCFYLFRTTTQMWREVIVQIHSHSQEVECCENDYVVFTVSRGRRGDQWPDPPQCPS